MHKLDQKCKSTLPNLKAAGLIQFSVYSPHVFVTYGNGLVIQQSICSDIACKPDSNTTTYFLNRVVTTENAYFEHSLDAGNLN